MKEFKYVITDPEGIHARPAGELVKATKEFQSAITLTKDGKTGDCKRIFGIMGLAVKAGNEITLPSTVRMRKQLMQLLRNLSKQTSK